MGHSEAAQCCLLYKLSNNAFLQHNYYYTCNFWCSLILTSINQSFTLYSGLWPTILSLKVLSQVIKYDLGVNCIISIIYIMVHRNVVYIAQVLWGAFIWGFQGALNPSNVCYSHIIILYTSDNHWVWGSSITIHAKHLKYLKPCTTSGLYTLNITYAHNVYTINRGK